MADKKTVLILGGGIGGQTAANALARRFNGRHRVVLVEKEAAFAFSPSFLWILTGERTPEQVQKPLAAMLRPGVEIVRAEATAIRPAERIVETSSGPLKFDALLISLGAELAPEKIPGFKEAALNLYALEGSLKIAERLREFSGGRVAVLISSSPFKCPAAPYEAAFLVGDFLKKRSVSAELAVFTPEPYPMPTAGPEVGAALRGMLEAKGIAFNPGHKVSGIDVQAKTISFDNGKTASFDLLIGVPPHQSPRVVRESGLANEAGWIPVDRETLATKHDGIFAVGDVSFTPLAQGKALPKAGVFAHAQAEIAAENIADFFDGRAPTKRFDGQGWCAIELGGGTAAFGSGNFFGETPRMRLYEPSKSWHAGKVLFEKWWLTSFGLKRELLDMILKWGARTKGVVLGASLAVLFSLSGSARCSAAAPDARNSSETAAAETSSTIIQTIKPEVLIKQLKAPRGRRPLILQVGFRVLYDQAHIPGSEYVGAVSKEEGRLALRQRVKNLPRGAAIVIYCGCCPWEHCPNIRPAWLELRAMGFKNVKALILPKNFGADWVEKGYPVSR